MFITNNKERNIKEDINTDDENEESNKNNKNQGSKIKIIKNNIINSRNLLFLRRDNIAYFVDINGRPLDSGSQKLFERNKIPCLRDLIIDEAKVIKYKKHYHVVLPVSEGQREGPMMTLSQISTVVKDLRNIIEKLTLEIVSITKTDFVNNVNITEMDFVNNVNIMK